MKTPKQARSGNVHKRKDSSRQRPAETRNRQGGNRTAQRKGNPRGAGHKPAPRRHDLSHANPALLFGRNGVLESLRGRRGPARRLWLAEGLRHDERLEEIQRIATGADIPVEIVPRMMLDDMTTGANHQGVVLDPADYPYLDVSDLIETGKTLLLLDHVQDPQNFGALIRAADAVDIGGVILPQDRSVSVTPSVVNASAGAVEHVAVALVANLNRTLERLEEAGYWTAGLAGDGDATDLFESDLPSPVALVVGSEGKGISQSVRGKCQLLLKIPMQGHVDSLNAATAGTVALYEVLRQRRASLT